MDPVTRRKSKELETPKVTILLVDDNVDVLNSMAAALEVLDEEILTAVNANVALKYLLKVDPAVIVLDVMMPDMDGYETMREIRQMRRFKETPMIALTAKAMKDDKEKCLAAGASDYVSKPADVDRLLSLLRVYLGK